MKLLLINPRFPESFWSFKWAVDNILPATRAINPPLGLATLAALTPAGWEIEIVDENIDSVPLETDADIVGVCGMGVQFARQSELLAWYRHRGHFVVAGGSYASLCPEAYEGLADSVVAGEAEYIWKEFCADFLLGAPQPLYRESGVVDLADSPIPRFDLLRLDAYANATVQFSRGCPFVCEFCDIIVMFGRKPRTKSVAQIECELDMLLRLGARSVFFVDDNFIGDKRKARELLGALVAYGERHGTPFRFGTEVSLNLASDEALLALFREANFQWLFIGIESPEEESLREAGKLQNMRGNMLDSIRRVHEKGIDVFAGFIVGFDNDTEATFERQYRFIVESGIQVAMVGLLTALPHTPLHARLEREGRLIDAQPGSDNTRLGTNVVPKRMSIEAMLRGYHELHLRLCSYRGIADRIRSKLRKMKRPLYRRGEGMRRQFFIALRFVGAMARPEPRRMFHFLRTLAAARPRQIPTVISDWITGLAMRDYVRRTFRQPAESDMRTVRRRVEKLQRRLQQYFAGGVLRLSFEDVRAAMPHLSLSIGGPPDRRFYRRTGRQLRRLMRKSGATLTLRIEGLEQRYLPQFEKFLRRLARFGDRISITVAERCRSAVAIDSSVFHVVLTDGQHSPGVSPMAPMR